MIGFLYTAFEYFVTLLESFLLVRFMFAYCGCRYEKWARFASFICTWSFLSAVVVLFNHVTIFESYAVYAYILVLFLAAVLFLEESVLQKAFSSIFAILLIVIINGSTMTIVAAVANMSLPEIYTPGTIERAIGILLTKVILYFALSAVATPKKKKADIMLTNAEWIQVLLVSVVSMFVITAAINFQLSHIAGKMHLGILSIIIGIVLLNAYFLYVVLKINRYNRIKQDNALLREQHAFREKYAESIKQQYEEMKTLRHDLKHSLSVLNVLIEEGKSEEAKEFIRKHKVMTDSPYMHVDTQNELLNAIVNAKLSQAHQCGIQTACVTSTSCKAVDDIDLCNLLGNLLDNAIEAAMKSAEKEVLLEISEAPGKVFIFVKNTVAESVLAENADLVTNKTNRREHGFGWKTIRSITDKYNGLTDVYEHDGCFCVLVTLFVDLG